MDRMEPLILRPSMVQNNNDHPKIKFDAFFTDTNLKKSAIISFSKFSLNSKMSKQVKIIEFIMVLGITRKVIITEQRTKS